MFVAIGGCGYAGTPPKPSVSVTVEPTSALVALGATQQFQATVTGSTDTAVEWEVNEVANGNAISGTVDGTGLYTAPAVMPSPASVTVTAISQVNPGDHASASVTFQAGTVTVTVQPTTALVTLGATQQFQATVSGSMDSSVAWKVNGVANGNAISGMVSGTGLYTAPVVMPSPASVTVTAISQANPADQASAVVTLQPGWREFPCCQRRRLWRQAARRFLAQAFLGRARWRAASHWTLMAWPVATRRWAQSWWMARRPRCIPRLLRFPPPR